MIEGVGTDIIEVMRIARSIDEHGKRFLDRLFTDKEQVYCDQHKESALRYAGRFAVKEAIVKAIGFGVNWTDIEVTNDEKGKPLATLSDALSSQLKSPKIHVSLSHCKTHATAVAVIER